MWREELELQGLVWKLKNLLFTSLGTIHVVFWVLQYTARVVSKPSCCGGSSEMLLAFSLLKSFPNPGGMNTTWDVCHISSFCVFLVDMRKSSREGFEAWSSSSPAAFFSLHFHSWSKANKPAYEKSFSCLPKELAGGDWQFTGIQEEVDFLLYKHLRIRL